MPTVSCGLSNSYLMNSEHHNRLTDAITLLSVPGIGKGRYYKLLRAFGSAGAALRASISKLEQVPSMSRQTASAVQEEQDPDKARELAARVVQLGWKVSFVEDDGYPLVLKAIDDPPPILFSDGQPMDPNENMIAIVGTRRASDAGRVFARNLAAQLAKAGVTVVSGMAEGIDAAAHQGALEAGGRTVAVWGTSLDIVYPPVHKSLAARIRESGTVCSEYFPGTRPDRAFFPERNRIISGLSAGVVVVEAGMKSGALITANLARAQGRDIFAMPGVPGSQSAAGTNQLIKEGARLITEVDDIWTELPALRGKVTASRMRQLPDLTETERLIIDNFADGPAQLDQLSRKSGLSVGELMEFLLALELKGVVKELSGKRFVLAEDFQ